jgi:hypothetical protein
LRDPKDPKQRIAIPSVVAPSCFRKDPWTAATSWFMMLARSVRSHGLMSTTR